MVLAEPNDTSSRFPINADTAVTASYALNGGGGGPSISSSYSTTSSYALTSTTSSYASASSNSSYSSTASYSSTSSYSTTSSYISSVNVSFPPSGSTKTVYVSYDGSDSTGDGTLTRPYASVSKSLQNISDSRTRYSGYLIKVGAGLYYENSLELKASVWIEGEASHHNQGATVIYLPSGNVTLHPNWSNNIVGARGGLSNLFIYANMVFDASGSTGSNTVLELRNITSNGSLYYRGKNNGDGMELHSSRIFGTVTYGGGGNNVINNSTLFGKIIVNPTNGFSTAIDVFNSINVGISASCEVSGLTTTVVVYGGAWAGGLTITQKSGSVTVYGYGAFPGGTINTGSGTFGTYCYPESRFLNYAPASSSDWNVVPTTIGAALDEIARRLRTGSL